MTRRFRYWVLMLYIHVIGVPTFLQELEITHLLDPMHIEGNVCKAILRQLFGYHEDTPERKAKNRAACQEFNMHPRMWDVNVPAEWILSKPARIEFKKRIMNARFPTRYAEDLAKPFASIGNDKPFAMKTHSRHKLLLDILPIALQGLTSRAVYEAIVDLSVLLRLVLYLSWFKIDMVYLNVLSIISSHICLLMVALECF